jgi:glycogen(starch) synthase
MRLLIVTNLYPPQELGGYGRSLADFGWGLLKRGHQVEVLAAQAAYLGRDAPGPSGETVWRELQLLGSFEGGVSLLADGQARNAALERNSTVVKRRIQQGNYGGVLLGNLDLLGTELLHALLEPGLPVLHHVGFVAPPFAPSQYPRQANYQLVAASKAVRKSLTAGGLPVSNAPVVYPGARVELFGSAVTGRPIASALGGGALKVCFAGLLMSSKGAHTLLEAAALLHQKGLPVEVMLAGGRFQVDYVEGLEHYIERVGLQGQVQIVGALTRDQLARFFSLNQVAVFPSIYPEAFGIVAAEAMASGLALVSSGAGGAGELFEPEHSGLGFNPGDASDLARQLQRLIEDPSLLVQLQQAGEKRVRKHFSVCRSVHQLEQLFQACQPWKA